MTIRAPSYELTIGSRRWTSQVLDIDVRLLGAPLLRRRDGPLSGRAPTSGRGAWRRVVRLDGGDGAGTSFTGDVDALVGRLDGTVVIAIDAGGDLARYRPAVTLEQATAATVIRALCDDAGVSVGTLDDGLQFAYYARRSHPQRPGSTSARVAGWGGAIARVDADGRVSSVVPGERAGGHRAPPRSRRDRRSNGVAARRPHRRRGSSREKRASGRPTTRTRCARRPTSSAAAGPTGPAPTAPGRSSRPCARRARATFADALRRARGGRDHRWRLESLLRPELRPGHGGDRRPPGPPPGRDVRRRVRAPCPRPMDRADAGPSHRGRRRGAGKGRRGSLAAPSGASREGRPMSTQDIVQTMQRIARHEAGRAWAPALATVTSVPVGRQARLRLHGAPPRERDGAASGADRHRGRRARRAPRRLATWSSSCSSAGTSMRRSSWAASTTATSPPPEHGGGRRDRLAPRRPAPTTGDTIRLAVRTPDGGPALDRGVDRRRRQDITLVVDETQIELTAGEASLTLEQPGGSSGRGRAQGRRLVGRRRAGRRRHDHRQRDPEAQGHQGRDLG